MKKRTGVYPGTFDPITVGHLDIIRRATRLVDHLIVGVAENAHKSPILSHSERTELVQQEIAPLVQQGYDIEVRAFDDLLIHFVATTHAAMIIRGLRATSDFEFEFQMTGMNACLDPNIETVFLMAAGKHQFVSSRFVKEIGKLNGDISKFVSPAVAKKLQNCLKSS